jgi:hypothetical protein
MPRWHITITWLEWWPLFYRQKGYLSLGIGPLFLEIDWGEGAPLWERRNG